MKLSAIKSALTGLDEIRFILPNGEMIPVHFHVTEIGAITRHFIDCGGTERIEKTINFQLWEADDFDHRLAPQKLLKIIELSEQKLGLGNLEVEVEYQSDTIGKYGLDFDGSYFLLTSKSTTCLASDQCGIPSAKPKYNLKEVTSSKENTCTPGGGCC